MSKSVDYFMAPQSPWSYMGHQRLVAIARKYGASIQLKPADIGKVFSMTGGVPVAQRPQQRQAYRLAELQRWSEFLNIPLNLHPKFFPVAAEPGTKLIIAALQKNGTDKALDLAFALGRAVWSEEKNIADEATLIDIAESTGLDGKALSAHAASDTVAADYAKNTEEALHINVFGVPWYRIDGQVFWGQDRLDFVERLLAR